MSKKKSDIEQVHEEPLALKFQPSHPEQLEALKCCQENAIAFLTGPPGTAKTYCATFHAISQLLNRSSRVRRIYLTRPAVTQGADIGFLPGDIQIKMDPYLRPVINSYSKLLAYDQGEIARLEASLEILPLSFIRGWTFENSILLVDEAQNLQGNEIKTICTRLGRGGQIIFTGDCTQGDLRKTVIEEAAAYLADLERKGRKVGWHKFTRDACVRDPLVSAIDEKCSQAEWAQ